MLNNVKWLSRKKKLPIFELVYNWLVKGLHSPRLKAFFFA